MPFRQRLTILIIAACLLLGVACLPPIAQDPKYHGFVDQRTLFGIPNFWNVMSNVPFFAVALFGLSASRSRHAFIEAWERAAYWVLLIATAAVGAGSIYYHLRPDNARLLWDRLPMAVVFMTLLAITIGERVDSRLGERLLFPAIMLGAASLLDWRITGDLRFYGAVQFGSILAIVLLLSLMPPRYSGSGYIWVALILYALAKTAELLDRQLGYLIATGGHPRKHVLAAGALFVYFECVALRTSAITARLT